MMHDLGSCCASCAQGGACESDCRPTEHDERFLGELWEHTRVPMPRTASALLPGAGGTRDADPFIPYDAAPFDDYNQRAQPMSWNRYEQTPFVYNDPLTRGGATGLRYAQTCEGSSAMPGMEPTGSGGHWRRQLGELGDVPFFCPPGSSWNLSTLSCEPDDGTNGGGGGFELPPGIVTEQECAAREKAAADEARDDARSEIITTTAIAAVVSGVIGWGLGKVLK